MRVSACTGLAVTLRVDGNDLQEYGDPDAATTSDTSTTSYVQTTAGSTFSVHFQKDRGSRYTREAVRAHIYLDGKRARGCTILATDRQRSVDGIRRVVDDQWILRRFQFDVLQTSDEALRSLRPKDLEDLGTVKINLARCIVREERPPTRRKDDLTVDKQSIPEKGLKGRAISNRASFAAPEGSHGYNVKYDLEYPEGKGPFATFIFKYRSRKDLQIEDIIPHSPSPVPLEDRDPDTLTLDEAREVLRRHGGQAKIKQEVKQEKRDHATMAGDDPSGQDDSEVSFTSERSKRSRVDAGAEVVDLLKD